MRHVLRVLCCLGYYYEKMGKESNPFSILTLATASKWLDKQILVSSRSQRGQPLEAGKTLFISPCLVPREVYRPQKAAWDASQIGRGGSAESHAWNAVQSPCQSPEGAKQLLKTALLAWNIQVAGYTIHFPFQRFSFLGVSISFLLEGNTQRALLPGT